MRTREDIESYLMRSNLSFKAFDGDDMWLVRDTTNSDNNIVVSLAGPLVLFRVKVLETQRVNDKTMLYERLLKLNAEDMLHGAYGISDDAIVLTANLPLENLDYNEFQATVDDLNLAIVNHYPALAAATAPTA